MWIWLMFYPQFAPCFHPGVLIIIDNVVDLMAYTASIDQRGEEVLSILQFITSERI